jgi:hypothetical protein
MQLAKKTWMSDIYVFWPAWGCLPRNWLRADTQPPPNSLNFKDIGTDVYDHALVATRYGMMLTRKAERVVGIGFQLDQTNPLPVNRFFGRFLFCGHLLGKLRRYEFFIVYIRP